MKSITTYLALSLCLVALTSCFSQVDDVIETEGDTTLKVTTRAASGDISYPVTILAYDASGNLKGQQTLQDDSQGINLQLNEGSYHITALSGQSSYSTPANYNQNTAVVSIPNSGYASQPLMMGGADVVLGSTSASANIVLTYRVASLNISLSSVPSDVTAVTIGVSQQYGAINMSGTYSGTSVANITCTKSNSVWKSGPVYVMPGAGSTTTLTLTLTNASGQTSYSYELSEALEAAVPYTIGGTYVEASVPYITGVLTVEGWQSGRQLSFEFGSGANNSGGQANVPTIEVDALPAQGTAWNGHVAAIVTNATSTEEDVLLLALSESLNVHAPAASGYETEMATIAASYNEGTMTEWSVPTEAEARSLRQIYGGNYDDLNTVISNLGGTLIDVYSTSNNARYLCEQGTKTFNFAANGTITSAGTSVKYRLRTIKNVHLVLR